MNASLSWRLLWLSLAAYGACMPLTAFCANGCAVSVLVLLIGWLGLFTLHPANLIWLANPAQWIAWGLIAASLRATKHPSSRSRALSGTAVWTSGLALFVGACFLLPVIVMGTGNGISIGPDPIGSRGAGYWLWLASMASAFASALHLPALADSGRAEVHR
jgi:hypothetical protein